ncbi:DUF5134 domain-containing protein [Pseudonocardia alaniniphila]|uniref:DUF5134 domain-containing protein n=1 Tax=Pseudonocardia alaniniphila TaxID=75291 RepID=A0ABS9TSJ4_9PSEU|nr:DUF5134 domain-containing protein [Pseudonocardia alaniniphila]MCH6171481.1 DUF5134 domain-containing protein [Pseudonocardia alaniniphila]
MTDQVSRWILSAAFAVAAGYYIARVAGQWRPRPRWGSTLGAGLHALMGIAMIAMLWSVAVPIMLYVTVFTGAMLWFIAEALFARPATGGPVVIGHDAWYHAMMMGSMVWMGVVMSTMPPPASAFSESGQMSSGEMASMAGMSMSGMSMSAPAPVGMDAMSGLPMWTRPPCVLLAVVFCAAAIRLVAHELRPVLFRRARTGTSMTAAVIGGLMAAAMAVTFAEMA